MIALYSLSLECVIKCPISSAAATVGLLCLKRAKTGGDSSWSSAVSVHNELLRRGRQDLVEELAKDQWYLDRKGEIPEGKSPFYRIPIFNYHQVSFTICIAPFNAHQSWKSTAGKGCSFCLFHVCVTFHRFISNHSPAARYTLVGNHQSLP